MSGKPKCTALAPRFVHLAADTVRPLRADNSVEVVDVDSYSRVKLRMSPQGTLGIPGVVVRVWRCGKIRVVLAGLHCHCPPPPCAAQAPPTVFPEFLNKTASGTEELVYFGSVFDGNVYALDLEECTVNMPAAGTESIVQAEPPCLRWKSDMGGAVMAPVRASSAGVQLQDDGEIYLFASTTDPLTDSQGMVHGLDGRDGTPRWPEPYNATMVVGDVAALAAGGDLLGANTSVVTTGIRNVVGMDVCHRVILVATGPRIVMLSAKTGQKLAEVPGTAGDPFKTAPVIFPNCSSAFVVAASGELWRLRIDIIPFAPFITMEMEWRCTYTPTDGSHYTSNCVYSHIDASGPKWVAAADLLESGAVAPQDVHSIAHVNKHGEQGLWVYDQAAVAAWNEGVVGDPSTLLPLGTPALGVSDNNMFYPLFSEQDPHGGALLKINTRDGGLHWAYIGANMGTAIEEPFGASRSSPAVDGTGDVIIASDSNRGPTPTLFAVRHDGQTQWSMSLDTETNDEVNNISPVIALSPEHVPRVYIATTTNLRVIEEGCPSSSPDLECSGNGACNCATRTCECTGAADGTGCHEGPACNEPVCGATNQCNMGVCTCFSCTAGPRCKGVKDCGEHGTCDQGTNECTCDNQCWVQGPDGKCDTPFQCPGTHAMCDPVDGCVCDLCFAGSPDCSTNTTCSGHGFCEGGGRGCQCKWDFFPTTDKRGCQACPFCLVGPNCIIDNACAGHGTCNSVEGRCECEAGWGGTYCQDAVSGKGRHSPGKAPNGGGIAVGIIFLILALAGIAFIIYARVKFPGRPYADACHPRLRPCCAACPSARSLEQRCLSLCKKRPGALAGQAGTSSSSAPATSSVAAGGGGAGYGSVKTSKGANSAAYSSL